MEITLLRIYYAATRKMNNCQRYQALSPSIQDCAWQQWLSPTTARRTLRTHLLPSCFTTSVYPTGPDSLDLLTCVGVTGKSSGIWSATSYANSL
jgi:hypothetical protein